MRNILSNILPVFFPCSYNKKCQVNQCDLSCYFQPINYSISDVGDILTISNFQLTITIEDISYYNPLLISCLKTSQYGLKAILYQQIISLTDDEVENVTNYFYNVILTINNDCNSIVLTVNSNKIINPTLTDYKDTVVYFGLSFGTNKCLNNMNYSNLESCIVFTLCETNECLYLTIPNKQWFNITNYVYYNSNSSTLANGNIIYDTLAYYYLNNIGCSNIQFKANLNIFNSLDYQNGNVGALGPANEARVKYEVHAAKKVQLTRASDFGPYYTTYPLIVRINRINGILNIFIYLENNNPVTIGLFGLNPNPNADGYVNNPNFITGLCINSSQLINIYNIFYNNLQYFQ